MILLKLMVKAQSRSKHCRLPRILTSLLHLHRWLLQRLMLVIMWTQMIGWLRQLRELAVFCCNKSKDNKQQPRTILLMQPREIYERQDCNTQILTNRNGDIYSCNHKIRNAVPCSCQFPISIHSLIYSSMQQITKY